MKTFKQYIKKSDGYIPVPIHFKEIPFEVALNEDANPNYTSKPYEYNSSLPHIHRWVEKCLQEHKDMHGDYDSNIIARDLTVNHILHSTHVDAINAYTFDQSGPLNKTLIEGHTDFSKYSEFPERTERTYRYLREAIDRNRLPKDVNVSSGIGFDPDKYVDENNRLHSRAFISTSLEPLTAKGFAFVRKPMNSNHPTVGDRHILHIALKRGNRAISAKIHSSFDEENEVVVDTDTTLQRHSVEKYHDPHYGTIHVHRMSVVE